MSNPDDIQRSLGRIEGKLEALAEAIMKHFDDDERNFGELQKQVDDLKKKVWFASGSASVIGAILGIFVKGHS